ncbi:MAG: hypothetical protein JXQ68_05460 [Campylobacterales bacterium]|nr:hypothetical protein [Campylobacterales bacterium]
MQNKNSYLHTTGWLRSLEAGKPIDKEGNPIPWINYPMIRFLEERLTDDLNVFEFGSGYSTLFYAEKVKSITSLEYDKNWFELIKSMVPKNAQLIYKKKDRDGEYCRAIHLANKKYDVIIIDGRDRVNCIKQSFSALSLQGVIILDDSQREWYKEGIVLVNEKGFRILNIEGLKPHGTDTDRTAIFYRDDNCLGI